MQVSAALRPRDSAAADSTRGAVGQWQADVSHDAAWREAMIRDMQCPRIYSDEETELIAKGSDLLGSFRKGVGRVRQLPHSNSIVSARTKYDATSGLIIGEATALIRASPEQVVAYLMHWDSKHKRSLSSTAMTVRFEVLERRNLHHTIVYLEVKTAPFQNRTFLQALLWRKVSDEPLSYVWVNMPIKQHPGVPPQDESHAVRGLCPRFAFLTRVGDDLTRMEFAGHLDLKGRFPKWLTLRLAIPAHMSMPYIVQTYFLQLLPLANCSEQDGAYLGRLLMDAALSEKEADREAAVSKFVEETTVLREEPIAHLTTILQMLAVNHFGLARSVATPDPEALTETEARSIGKGFLFILIGNTMPEAAVDEFILKYAAVRALAESQVWVRPMLLQIAKRHMGIMPLGMKLRVTIGAVLSIGDVFSDLYMTIFFFRNGNTAAAYGTVGMVALALLMQVVLVLYQHRHQGRDVLIFEIGIVLCFLKPAFDAFRVATANSHVDGAPFDPLEEMFYVKVGSLRSTSCRIATLH